MVDLIDRDYPAPVKAATTPKQILPPENSHLLLMPIGSHTQTMPVGIKLKLNHQRTHMNKPDLSHATPQRPTASALWYLLQASAVLWVVWGLAHVTSGAFGLIGFVGGTSAKP